MTTTPTLATCGGPSCEESLESRPPGTRYCSTKCRKGAYRERQRAERQAPEYQKPESIGRRTRVTRPDPAQMVAEAEAFQRQLARETEASLRRDPTRWRHCQAADPDEHRRRVRRQPWRSTS